MRHAISMITLLLSGSIHAIWGRYAQCCTRTLAWEFTTCEALWQEVFRVEGLVMMTKGETSRFLSLGLRSRLNRHARLTKEFRTHKNVCHFEL